MPFAVSMTPMLLSMSCVRKMLQGGGPHNCPLSRDGSGVVPASNAACYGHFSATTTYIRPRRPSFMARRRGSARAGAYVAFLQINEHAGRSAHDNA